MPIYRNGGNDMAQMANSAMSSATNAMAHQTKQTTTIRKKESNFWDDLEKGAKAVNSIAGAVNTTVGAIDKGIDLYDKTKVKGAYDDIARTFADGGLEAIQNNPEMRGYHHSLALGQFMKDRANTKKGRLEMMQKADEAADRMYQDFRNNAFMVRDAYAKGNIEAFNNGMVNLAANAPIPYRLQADGKGNFQELFRSDQAGGWTPTGRTLTAQQAIEQMEGVLRGEQMVLRGANMQLSPYNETFRNRAIANYLNTVNGNAANRADPRKYVPLYDRNGNVAGSGLLQNPWEYNGKSAYGLNPQIEAFDRNGKLLGTFDGWESVNQHGLSPMTPQKMTRGGGGHGRGRGRSGGHSGSGAGGMTGLGPKANPQFHNHMLEQGYTWSPQQRTYRGPDGSYATPEEIRLRQDALGGGTLFGTP